MQDFILIFFGLILWVFGANWLLKGAAALSLKFNIPKIIVGMTVVSLATSLPELLLSVKAVTEGVSDLALGTAMGSNMVNLGLILALVLILSGVEVPKPFYRAKWSVLMLATTLFFGFIYFDGEIQGFEGFFMLAALFLFLIYLLWFQREEEISIGAGDDRPHALYGALLFLGLGGLALWIGSEVMVRSAWWYAVPKGAGVSNIVTVLLSVGVAIPELVVVLIAIIKKQKDILLGNLMGANMFNLLGALGISARIVGPIKVMDPGLLTNDILWLMGISFMLLPLLFFSRGSRLDWKSGLVLLGIYLAFAYFTLI